MRMFMRRLFMAGMIMAVGTMLISAGMSMVMRITFVGVGVVMTVFMAVFMGMGVDMFMRMFLLAVSMFVVMGMRMLMVVLVLVFMLTSTHDRSPYRGVVYLSPSLVGKTAHP